MEKKIKLSDKQKELLKVMQGGSTCGVSGITSNNRKFMSNTTESLLKAKLIQQIPGHLFTYEISELGKTIDLT